MVHKCDICLLFYIFNSLLSLYLKNYQIFRDFVLPLCNFILYSLGKSILYFTARVVFIVLHCIYTRFHNFIAPIITMHYISQLKPFGICTQLIRSSFDSIYIINKTNNNMKTLTNNIESIILTVSLTTIVILISYNIIVNGIINYISFNGI